MRNLTLVIALCCTTLCFAQITNETLDRDLPWRNIGPSNMMGRIAAIDALNSDYRHVVIASASGGVFKSTNGGITWDAIFDKYGVGSIGSVTLNQSDPDIIWVGTGESANRNSSGWGNGIYRSDDGGKTFVHKGLEDTHHIAEIALHPEDPDVAYAAAVGHLWGYSGSRGLFRTTDGGTSWQKLGGGLPDDGKTGCTEIIMHPSDPNTLFAGFYHRLRQPATYQSGGGEGGLFKSTDGGETWRRITNGLAEGSSGMIDISIHLANPDIMVMAYEADEKLNEKGYTLTSQDLGRGELDKEEILQPGSGVYRSDDGGETWTFLLKHAVRPFYHGQIEIDPIDPDNIYVVSRGARISRDGGKTFGPRRQRTDGGDDHDMWIAPYDNKIMYLATDQGARLSVDMGRSWLSFNNMAIGQYYAIGVDMRDPYWIGGGLQDNGLWMGPSNSRERRGILKRHNTWIGEGDGFHTQIDPTDWRTVYIVNHVGFAARLNVETREHWYITPTPETIANFDDWVDPDFPQEPIRYTIYPGEHWFFGERPERPLLPPQFRFNWSSPLVMSPNNPHTIYFGGNYLFKSVDKGETWRIISPDLTTNDPELRDTSDGGGLTNSNTGGENHFTIITIDESPLDEAVVWVGTDDGNVQVTRNGGTSWENVKMNIGVPEKIWVSRVEASHHVKGRAYVTFDNHRYDDFKPYVFRTDDYGKSWVEIGRSLPDYSVYVIKEDPVNPDLLFIGTESAAHYSLDGGASWNELMTQMPNVAFHDLVIHPREGDLIAGTHGRSIWILDDITPLRQFSKEVSNKTLHAFKPKTGTIWQQVNIGRTQPAFEFRGENPPRGALLHYYLQTEGSVSVHITSPDGLQSAKITDQGSVGINRVSWDFTFYPTEEDLEKYKRHLRTVVKQLENMPIGTRIKRLQEINKSLNSAGSMRELNNVRSMLVADFSAFAGGKKFFGPKLEPSKAQPGQYVVTFSYGSEVETVVLAVRRDPLIQD